MSTLKLYMVLLGGKPEGRHTEQHDIFFGIAENLQNLIPDFENFWPEMKNKMHIDCWREVTCVDGFSVSVVPKTIISKGSQLFFLNLGGYKPDEFEEYHYKMVVVADEKSKAIQTAKETIFFKHNSFEGAVSHIDDKYGIDVDDIYTIEDILPIKMKTQYSIVLRPTSTIQEDELHIGYLKMSKLIEM
ncbi:MAG: DUF1543 domain-containing protein [Pseudopedobacter saltans]|uniref:DUF1543 domain-containing protein n=1 Tax=Pseudopedobacter saltans TaxID=151895 RepID=A0A2W5F4F5_9SPHI|nr:MAG: DUF1543 domain-containing protein [Pseudopedobacter saltans]